MSDDPAPESSRNPTDDASAGKTPLPPLVIRSEDLLAGRREVLIKHGEAVYRLRVTAQGRLILTK